MRPKRRKDVSKTSKGKMQALVAGMLQLEFEKMMLGIVIRESGGQPKRVREDPNFRSELKAIRKRIKGIKEEMAYSYNHLPNNK